jgi:hypothetical protein
MSHHDWLESVRRAMNMELREIALMAQLAEQLPSHGMRMRVIEKIAEEAFEANFWNCIHACFDGYYAPGYCGVDTKDAEK